MVRFCSGYTADIASARTKDVDEMRFIDDPHSEDEEASDNDF